MLVVMLSLHSNSKLCLRLCMCECVFDSNTGSLLPTTYKQEPVKKRIYTCNDHVNNSNAFYSFLLIKIYGCSHNFLMKEVLVIGILISSK